jgi:2',3'-cyclic-nucleotide 2'-phosphodiesterase (5'-nucleotidase family)
MTRDLVQSRSALRLGMLATLLVLLALLLGGLPVAPAAGADEPVEITILHDTHFHGRFSNPHSTIARYMALAEARKGAHEHAIFVGNGDDLAPSVEAGVFFGRHMIDALNVSPLDINTYGNHEFDFGPENLLELVEDSAFQWVSANVIDNRTDDVFGAEVGAERFVIRDFGGVQVGFTGLGPRGMATITSMGEHAIEVPAIEAMTEVVPMMRAAGADIIVVASHLCAEPDARDLAAAVDGIDVIVGDHCAESLVQPEIVNDTILSFVGDEFRWLGELTLTVEGGDIAGFAFTRHDLSVIQPDPHPAVQAVVDEYTAQLDEALSEEIGTRAVEWDTRRATVRSREEAFANFVTDAMRELHDADIAFTNGGGIRGDRIYGADEPIIRRDIVENLPFPNTVVKAQMSGSMLRDVLEHALSGLEGVLGQFLHYSGVEVIFDASRPVGERVVRATVGCEPIDDTRMYTFATNDFLLGGGDAFVMLRDAEVLVPGHEGPLMSAFIMDVVQAVGVVDTPVEGRITRIGTDDPHLCPLASAAFVGVPGQAQAGRTVPLEFTAVDDTGAPLTADALAVRLIHPDGSEESLDVKGKGRDRFQVLVRTARGVAGDYTVVVSQPDGVELGRLTLTAGQMGSGPR